MASLSDRAPKVGARVKLKDKDLLGQVVYVGLTEFAAGKWIGVVLDEPKGKNNGIVQGKEYFRCKEKHGMFVRQTQLVIVEGDVDSEDSRPPSAASTSKDTSPKMTESTSSSSLRAAATPTRVPTSKSAIPKPGAAGAVTGSRLPMPGRGPTGNRSPSFTNLKAAKSPKEIATPAPKKERSFVEKDFQQTVAASASTSSQRKSGSPASTASASAAAAAAASPAVASAAVAATGMTERMEDKVATIQAQQELLHTREVVRDLEEKLETLRIKRAKDQERLKELEKLRIQHDQLLEFKSRIMDSQSLLQKDVQKARHEAREAIEAKERHAEEMSDLSETVEMATLDKEMAEEKAEALQIELEAAKERIEELTLDLDIIKAEMGDDGAEAIKKEGGLTNFEAKQMAAQNEKLRETLVRMRDLLAHEKAENARIAKDLEEKSTSSSDLIKKGEKLSTQNAELEATISDLQEQVDAALGAEEMVENLTAKCLDMEDKMAGLVEEKEDLEKLHDLNEELQENAREVELQLREELDITQGKVRELVRSREAAFEVISDHEKTIRQFREHVRRVQEQNSDLRAALEKESAHSVESSLAPAAAVTELMSFKAAFEENRAHARAVDMELRVCDAQQARQHATYLSSYLGESFSRRGGDREAVLVLLLVPRMIWKAGILSSHVRETLIAEKPEKIDVESLLKGHQVERYAFLVHLLHHVEVLTARLGNFSAALCTCSPETFLRVGTCYPEMAVHEKAVDFYLELVKKSQLDEGAPLEHLEKGIHYFGHIFGLYFEEERVTIDHPSFLRDHVKIFSSAVEALTPQLETARLLLDKETDSDMGGFLKAMDISMEDLKREAKAMRRRMPTDDGAKALVTFPESAAAKMTAATAELMPVVRAVHRWARSAAQQAGLQGEDKLPPAKLSELLHQAVALNADGGIDDGGLATMRSRIEKASKLVCEVSKSFLDGEWDVDVLPPKPTAPVAQRAEAYKAEIREAESLRLRLEKKDEDVKEMKLAIRAKAEELSEAQVRKDKAEKKLLDLTRDSELMREKLQRKVDDLQVLLKKKEKDFEVTMEHLQADIDQLEGEKGELKDKIKDITKKTLFNQLHEKSAAAVAAVTAGPMSMGPSLPMPVKDSPRLRQQLSEMQTALLTLQESAHEKEFHALSGRLAGMKPISSAITTEHDKVQLTHLQRKAEDLQAQLFNALVSPGVVDLRRRQPLGLTAETELALRSERQRALLRQADELQLEVARLRAARTPGGSVSTELGAEFPSNVFARAYAEKELSLVGRLRLPAGSSSEAVPIVVGPSELRKIHQSLLA